MPVPASSPSNLAPAPVASWADDVTGTAQDHETRIDDLEASFQSGVTDGDKGDITVSGAGTAWAINAGAVTAAKVAADVATQAELDATGAVLAAHINDATDAHAATAVSFTPTGLIVATDVQAALAELDAEKVAASTLTTDGDLLTRAGGVPARLTRADLATDPAFSGTYAPAFRSPPPAGMFIVPNGGTAAATPFGSVLLGCWLFLPAAASVDRIGLEVTTAGAVGDEARLYLYRLGSAGDELDQVIDAGTVPLDSTGFKEITITETLTAGTYAGLVYPSTVTGSPQLRARANATVLGLYAPEQAAIPDHRGGIHAAQLGAPGLPLPATLPWQPGTRALTTIIYLRAA